MIIMCYLGVTGKYLSLEDFIKESKCDKTLTDTDYYLAPGDNDSPEEFADFVYNLQYTVKECNVFIPYDKSVLQKLIEANTKPLVIIPKATDVMRYLDIYKTYKQGLDIIMRKRFFNDIRYISANPKIYVYSLPNGKSIKDGIQDILKYIEGIKK